MREEDLDSYFKFMDNFERIFASMDIIEWESVYVYGFIKKYHKTQMRSNFLQTRTTQQQQDKKTAELQIIQLLDLVRQFKEELALNQGLGNDQDALEEFSFQESQDRIKDLQDKIALLQHNTDLATALISEIVVFYQNVLFSIGNRSLGPIIVNLRICLPHLVNPDDQQAQGVLRKYNHKAQMQAERDKAAA